MSRDLGRDVPDLEKLYARKLWAVFVPYVCNLGGGFAVTDLTFSDLPF